MAGGDGGPCGCGVLGCGFDVGDAPGDDGVGEQGESFALDVLAVGVSAASLISAICCSTDVATSRGYALELFGALRLQSLRIAITTAAVVPSTKALTPLLPTPQHLPVVRIGVDPASVQKASVWAAVRGRSWPGGGVVVLVTSYRRWRLMCW